MTRSSWLILAFAVLFAASILRTARRLRTHERHTFSWLLVCAAIGLLALWRPAVDRLAEVMGIYYPPSALFFGATAGLMWLVYRLSLEVARQRQQLRRLAQELALLNVSDDQGPRASRVDPPRAGEPATAVHAD